MVTKRSEKIYPVIIALFAIFVYYWLVFITYIKDFKNDALTYVYISLIHIELFMILWSMVATMNTDPGIQPVFWVI